MARNYIRTTTRGYTKEQIINASHEVISDKKSIRETAKKYVKYIFNIYYVVITIKTKWVKKEILCYK